MNDFLDALLRGDPRVIAAALVLGSILVHMLASNAAWRVTQRATPTGLLARLIQLAQARGGRAVYELLRLIYYIGVPFAALYLGWVDVRALGLGNLDWAEGLRWTIVLALATWSLLMFVWVPFLRATAEAPAPRMAQSLTWARRIVEVIYMQAHWAFYRAASILVLTSVVSDDAAAVYWGTSAGLALTFVEAWADPRVRRHLTELGESDLALWSAAQAIINAIGFVLTRNVWLLALIHFAMEFSVPHLRPMPAPSPPLRPATPSANRSNPR